MTEQTMTFYPKALSSELAVQSALRTQASADGLYRHDNEHDACGVGFVAHIKGERTHNIVSQGLQILINLDHRGAVGADP